MITKHEQSFTQLPSLNANTNANGKIEEKNGSNRSSNQKSKNADDGSGGLHKSGKSKKDSHSSWTSELPEEYADLKGKKRVNYLKRGLKDEDDDLGLGKSRNLLVV